MKFLEIEPGVTINLDTIASFEEFRGGKTKVIQLNGESFTANISYDNFKSLMARQSSGIERQLNNLSRQIATPTP